MNKQKTRRQQALEVREAAAALAAARPHPSHISNGDEQRFRREVEDGSNKPSGLMSFTKGLPHCNVTGLVHDPDHFQQFIKAINSGDVRDFRDTPLGYKDNCAKGKFSIPKETVEIDGKEVEKEVELRAWESQSAGLAFELEGHDAQSVTMPPAPRLGSDELSGEMAEVYVQAILRDMSFEAYNAADPGDANYAEVLKHVGNLNKLRWFTAEEANAMPSTSVPNEDDRWRGPLTVGTAFRGITPGDCIGPYISQFMLVGTKPRHERKRDEKLFADPRGLIEYGAIRVDQRVDQAEPEDYMQDWANWLRIQNGVKPESEKYKKTPRFIYTPRDLATYVHYDALYEAYLNACLLMLSLNVPLDPGLPFLAKDKDDHQQGFAHFGGPHILSLVTEVATRALKAVRFQKFNIHRRLRPEALAARVEKSTELQKEKTIPELAKLYGDLDEAGILKQVAKKNKKTDREEKYLLPMAFPEGSPMHPTYGAGHATVAGACVTILKAFFDSHQPFPVAEKPGQAYLARENVSFDPSKPESLENEKVILDLVDVFDYSREIGVDKWAESHLTIEGELNKLASNISIGRNWAGVHYFSEYIESLRMGEQIALSILEEQKLTYGENFTMTVPLFDGTARMI